MWKDISSLLPRIVSLPLVTLPHIITSSLAVAILSDLMPRLSHSDPSIRKKTVVALYRLALVYPDTLRPAWPKIKDLLMDDQEDPSVTAAIINVVCELGWRRPQDFLPVAPRLFNLLLEGDNNWMAIKVLKLVCTSIAYHTCWCQYVTVCNPHFARTAFGQKAIASADQFNSNDPRNVSAL